MKRTVILLALLALGASGGSTAISFEMKWSLDLGKSSYHTWPADLDNDGLTDFLRWHHDTATVNLRLNQGDGTFATKTLPAATWFPIDFRTGDFNDDGRTDLVATGDRTAGMTAVGIWLNDGAGGYALTWIEADVNYLATPLDIDEDGDVDVVAFGEETKSVSVLRNDGSGGFAAPEQKSLPDSIRTPRIADLSGNGRPELVLPQGGAVAVLRLADLGIPNPILVLDLPSGDVRLADFDGDLDVDLMGYVGSYSSDPGASPPGLYLRRGRGDGTFEEAEHFDTGAFREGGGHQIWAADYDEDGDIDVATNGPGSLTILPNPGDGTFSAGTGIFCYRDDKARKAYRLTAGEFDGEEGVDLLAEDHSPHVQILTASEAVPPTITTLTPFRYEENHAHEVTIRGTGFDPAATLSISSDFDVLGFWFIDSGELKASIIMPDQGYRHPRGTTYDLTVVNPTGLAATARNAIEVQPEFDLGLTMHKGKLRRGKNEKRPWRLRTKGIIDPEDRGLFFGWLTKGFTVYFGDPDGDFLAGFEVLPDDPNVRINKGRNKITIRVKNTYRLTIRRTGMGIRYDLSVDWPVDIGLTGRIYVGIEVGNTRVFGEEVWPEVKEEVFRRPKKGAAK